MTTLPAPTDFFVHVELSYTHGYDYTIAYSVSEECGECENGCTEDCMIRGSIDIDTIRPSELGETGYRSRKFHDFDIVYEIAIKRIKEFMNKHFQDRLGRAYIFRYLLVRKCDVLSTKIVNIVV